MNVTKQAAQHCKGPRLSGASQESGVDRSYRHCPCTLLHSSLSNFHPTDNGARLMVLEHKTQHNPAPPQETKRQKT